MPSANKNITVGVSPEDFQEITKDAHEADPTGSIGAYVRQIILGRHEMEIHLSPEVEKIKLVLQTQISSLEKENIRLLDKLTDIKQSVGLAGLDQKKDKLAERDVDIRDTIRKEFEAEADRQKNQHLAEQHRLLTARHKELEEELEETQSTLATYTNYEKLATIGSTLAGNVLGSSPMLQQRIANNGLGRLLFGNPDGSGAESASLTTDQQADLKVGMAIRADFAGDEQRLGILTILRYLRDNREVITQIMNSQPFKNFVQRTQQQAQQA